MCSPSKLIFIIISRGDWELRAAVANLQNRTFFTFSYSIFNFLSNRPAQNDPQTQAANVANATPLWPVW